MQNVHIKSLLEAFFGDDDFTKEFYMAPAAIVDHHNYMGGLLDHCVEILEICRTMCKIFQDLDKDLLYCGVLLHDIGKIKTYTYGTGPIGFSEEGDQLNHIYISCEMVKERMVKLETPEKAIKSDTSHDTEPSWIYEKWMGFSCRSKNTQGLGITFCRQHGCQG